MPEYTALAYTSSARVNRIACDYYISAYADRRHTRSVYASSSIINSSSSNSSSLAKKDPQRHPSCPHRHKASVEISAAAATLPSKMAH